jgi:hypothetical protein
MRRAIPLAKGRVATGVRVVHWHLRFSRDEVKRPGLFSPLEIPMLPVICGGTGLPNAPAGDNRKPDIGWRRWLAGKSAKLRLKGGSFVKRPAAFAG